MLTRILAALVALYLVSSGPDAPASAPEPQARATEAQDIKTTLAAKALDYCLANPATCSAMASRLNGSPERAEKPVTTGAIRASEAPESRPEPTAIPALPVPPRRRSSERS